MNAKFAAWTSSCLAMKLTFTKFFNKQIDGLAQNLSISIANTLEILQSCTKPSK